LLEGEGMSLIPALIFPLWAAFLAVSCCLPRVRRFGDMLLLKISLALGLALGTCSCLFFLKLVVFPLAARGYLLVEATLFLVLTSVFAAALVYRNRMHPVVPGSDDPNPAIADLPVKWRWILGLGCVLAATIGLSGSIMWLVLSPHGDWDGWAIWNTHARFLYRGGEHWADYVTGLEWTHPDYPLMMPANLARLWTYAGRESLFEHRFLDLLFLAATCGLLAGALARLRSRSQGLLAVMILATTGLFLEKGSSQYSDIPLSYFVLATLALLCVHESSSGCRGLVALAGAAGGFAAWTKNEGVMFLVAVLAVRCVVIVRACGWRAWGREVLVFCVGLAPALICLAYFKARLAPINDLVAGQGPGSTVERLLSPFRYGQIVGAYGLYSILIGPGTVVALGVYYVLLGKSPRPKHHKGRTSCLLVLAFMLAGYAAAFLITPHNLGWHLTVLDRLFMQVWPLALFTFFLTVATPEEALAKKAMQENSRVE